MIKNYFILAIRNLKRDLFYSLMNILGLTIGISSSLLLLMYVIDDLSYDRYHENRQNIYRIGTHFAEPDDEFSWAVCPMLMAPQLKMDFPQVKEFVRIFGAGQAWYKFGDTQYIEDEFMYADSAVFKVFTYPLIVGDPEKALTAPNSIVLSESVAKKYFGNNDPLGKVLEVERERSYTVTGVMKDIPKNSHIWFDALISVSTLQDNNFGGWGNWGVYTYVLLQDGNSGVDFEKLLPQIYENYQDDIFGPLNIKIEYEAQPVTRIHLHSTFEGESVPVGNMSYIYIFSAVIILMLIIASINYMNLAIARSVRRAREVGIRKVVGSGKGNLIGQFLTESSSHAFISMFISLIVVYLMIPYFNNISGRSLQQAYLFSPMILLSLLAISIFVGFIGGSYPAFYLSSFNPIKVLKVKFNTGKSLLSLRKILVILQFAISCFMIISTWVVYDQLNYLKNMDVGFNKENVVRLNLSNRNMVRKSELLKEKLMESPAIKIVGTSSNTLGDDSPKVIFKVETSEGMSDRGINFFRCDYDFLETVEIRILKGRGFSRDYLSDSTSGVIVNQVLTKRLNWNEPLGKKVQVFGDTTNTAQVVGLMKDFHQTGMYNPLESLMLLFNIHNPLIYIRTNEGSLKEALKHIETVWDELFPGNPFEYTFLDEEFGRQFKEDEMRGKMFTFFSILTILVACLGLFSLSAYSVEQRSKEIGIRKVMGASSGKIVNMVIFSYIGLIAVAIVIAFAGGYYFGQEWLDRFVYKGSLSFIAFAVSALITIILTVITVGSHAFRASNTNPAEVLKDE